MHALLPSEHRPGIRRPVKRVAWIAPSQLPFTAHQQSRRGPTLTSSGHPPASAPAYGRRSCRTLDPSFASSVKRGEADRRARAGPRTPAVASRLWAAFSFPGPRAVSSSSLAGWCLSVCLAHRSAANWRHGCLIIPSCVPPLGAGV